jgi:hypothetical protein
MLAAAAFAAEPKTYNFLCKGGNFSITAVIELSDGGVGRWSKTQPVILRIDAEPPQTLVADPNAPDADSFRNKDYEFYALNNYITLTHKSHGTVVKFYSACRVQ